MHTTHAWLEGIPWDSVTEESNPFLIASQVATEDFASISYIVGSSWGVSAVILLRRVGGSSLESTTLKQAGSGGFLTPTFATP